MLPPSTSVALAEQVRVELSYAVVGVTVTLVITGAELPTDTEPEVMAVPVVVPSLGVAVQVTAWPVAKLPLASVLLVWPDTVPPATLQL